MFRNMLPKFNILSSAKISLATKNLYYKTFDSIVCFRVYNARFLEFYYESYENWCISKKSGFGYSDDSIL